MIMNVPRRSYQFCVPVVPAIETYQRAFRVIDGLGPSSRTTSFLQKHDHLHPVNIFHGTARNEGLAMLCVSFFNFFLSLYKFS